MKWCSPLFRLRALSRLLACFQARNWISTPPARTVDRTQEVGREVRNGKVREHEVPAVADKARSVGFDTFCPGFSPSLFAPLPGDDAAGADRHETTFMAGLARLRRHVDDASTTALEQPFEGLAAVAPKAEGQRDARQPPRPASFNFNELRQGEVAHVPEHEIVFPHHRDELLADGLVLLGGGLEGVRGDLSGEQVVGEVELHPGGTAVPVAMGGEGPRVGLGQGLNRGVLHEDATDHAQSSVGKTRGKPLPEETVHHPGEKGGGRFREAPVDRLAADGRAAALRQTHGNLIVRGETGGHRTAEGLKEGRGVHFGRLADHKTGFPCESVEIGENEERGVGRRDSLHRKPAGSLAKSRGNLLKLGI